MAKEKSGAQKIFDEARKVTIKADPIKTDHGDLPPVIYTMDNEDYHASSGISRSGLWTIHKKTPFHYRFGSVEETKAMALGTATGVAVLEPDTFEGRYQRATAERRGTKDWNAEEAEAKANGAILIKGDEYDKALAMRESAHANSVFNKLISGSKSEQSAYWIDPETGVLCKCRPDIHNPKLKIIGDLKTSADAGLEAFGRSILNYGYHVQEAFYTDGWKQVGDVEGFVFAVIESAAPHALALYELPPAACDEGRQIVRESLKIYADCLNRDKWPGYPENVVPCDIPRYGYKYTQPDSGE